MFETDRHFARRIRCGCNVSIVATAGDKQHPFTVTITTCNNHNPKSTVKGGTHARLTDIVSTGGRSIADDIEMLRQRGEQHIEAMGQMMTQQERREIKHRLDEVLRDLVETYSE